MSTGRLTHFGPALLDRELAGYRLHSQQVAAGISDRFHLVAYPPMEVPDPAAIRNLIQRASRLHDPELKGWTV